MQRSPVLEQLTRALYEAVSAGDASFFARHLSQQPGSLVIGTAPHEWWERYDDAMDAIRAQMRAGGDAVAIVAGVIDAYELGDAGWVADRPTITFGSLRVPCRHTSVFVREHDGWRIVQDHFSVGVPNDRVFGEHGARLG